MNREKTCSYLAFQVLTAFLICSLTIAQAQKAETWKTPFELSSGNTTATYQQCIEYYKKLSSVYAKVKISEGGLTDTGLPLHVVVISEDGNAAPEPELTRKKRVVFIQNGIHPGEPEGIDASMMLARDLVQNKRFSSLLNRITVVIIPVFNVEGALNRNTHSRANQNGPESYGFRGNARNLDQNRDYIKLDSRNTKSLVQIYRTWQPDIFIDTHTSNGADYQHVLTLLATQPNRLEPELAAYQKQLLSKLYGGMEQRKFPLTPYVNHKGETPDSGIAGFLDNPRYSTGYTALFNCLGFMTETHMLKPFKQRVEATYTFLELVLENTYKDHQELLNARTAAIEKTIGKNSSQVLRKSFPINFKQDTSKYELITFRGYKAQHKISEVSGLNRLYYDRKKPYRKQIKYFNHFIPAKTIESPYAYVVPQAWHEVVERLKLNGVQLRQLKTEAVITTQVAKIGKYETVREPYEGHYLHHNTQLNTEVQKIRLAKGDYIVVMDQPANRFIVEVLEPEAVDSYFNWNFFDSILQQKEWFSDYVFEDIATEILQIKPDLRRMLEEKKTKEPEFAANAWAQLYFVYQNSDYMEKSFKLYPVLRLDAKTHANLE